MIARCLLIVLGATMVLPAAPVSRDCFTFPETTHPPHVCDWWDIAGHSGLIFPGDELYHFGMRPRWPGTYTGSTPVNPGDTQTADFETLLLYWRVPAGEELIANQEVTSTITLTAVDPGVRYYDTELLRLDFAFGGRQFRLSPSPLSLGEMIIRDHISGLVGVEAYYDVHFEISEDGGESWTPYRDVVRLEATNAMPEPAAWGVVLAGLVAVLSARRARAYNRTLAMSCANSSPTPEKFS